MYLDVVPLFIENKKVELHKVAQDDHLDRLISFKAVQGHNMALGLDVYRVIAINIPKKNKIKRYHPFYLYLSVYHYLSGCLSAHMFDLDAGFRAC